MGSTNRRFRPVATAIAAVFAACLVGPPAASAAFGLDNFTADPLSTQAGANSDLSIDFELSEGKLKNLVIHLPPGLVGNPLAAPTCSEADLNASGCPSASDVGDISNVIHADLLPLVPIPVSGQVYNVVPRPGEPARFGFVLSSGIAEPIILQAPASLRPGDLGLDTTLNDVPTQALLLGGLIPVDITIESVALDLEGEVGTPAQGFLRNPTSCGTNTVSADATAHDGSTGTAQDTFDTTNCAALPFSPEFSASIEQSGPSTDAVELSTTISQTIEEAGLKRAAVTLPAELTADGPAIANTCPDANFQAGTCPPATVLGSARAASPLQAQPLAGNVYLVPSTTGNFLPDIGVDLRGSLALKLKGNLSLAQEPAGLRAIVTFDNLPDIPIAEFTLTFTGGPNGLNDAAPNLCALKPTFNTSFLAHSGATADLVTQASTKCGKKPLAKLKLGKLSSGEPTLRLKVKAGSERLTKAKLKLPKGLRFAGGKAFDRGSSGRADGKKLALKHGRRSLSLKAKSGAKKLKTKVGKGALLADGKLGSKKKLRFKLKLRDSKGKSTALTVRPK